DLVHGGAPDGNARPRVIRGTHAKPLPLLPSGPGGVCGRALHEARSLTNTHANMRPLRFRRADSSNGGPGTARNPYRLCAVTPDAPGPARPDGRPWSCWRQCLTESAKKRRDPRDAGPAGGSEPEGAPARTGLAGWRLPRPAAARKSSDS